MMEYKGYFGGVALDAENNVFHGEVVGVRDVITFQGKSVSELRKAFRDSVDDYLEFCRQRGESPDKPLSGRFVLRISPELHRKAYTLAAESGQSLNSFVVDCLKNEVERAGLGEAGGGRSRVAGKGKRRETSQARRK